MIITSDISSLYPTAIINYRAIRFKEVLQRYIDIRSERLIAKKEKDKMKDSFLKLCLNSFSGLLDNEYSWLYYPEGIMKVRCGGQLILLELTDRLLENGFTPISLNTDGIEVRLKRSELDKYYQIISEIEKSHNLLFEHDTYSKIVYQNVNSYIAITESGKVKEKGMFVRKPELGNSTDFLIIPNMLYDYFVSGIPPEKSIYNYNDIYLFCASQKVDKTYTVEWNNKPQQRLNRYYASNKGAYLYKCRGV